MSTTILTSLHNINIRLFNDILESGNRLLLIKEYNENKEYSSEIAYKCEETWIKLFDEYYTLKDSGKARNNLKKNNTILSLSSRISIIQQVIDMLLSVDLIENDNERAELKIKTLNILFEVEKGFKRKVNVFDSIEEIINMLVKLHRKLTNDLDNETKYIEKGEKRERSNIERSFVAIQNVLGYYLGKLEDISVTMFIELEKSANEKLETIRKQQQKGKQ